MRIILIVFFSFQLQAQTWIQLLDFPATGRDDAAMFMINEKAYCLSGLSVNGCESDMYSFDCVTENWSSAASMPAGKERQYAAAFSYNGKGYVLCGVDCNNNLKKDFFEYDPVNNSWQVLPDFPGSARHGAHCIVNGNKMFLIGGYDGVFLNDVWEYDLISTTWIQKNNIPLSGFWRGSVFVINGKNHIAFGFTNSNSFNHFVYQYDEFNDSWGVINNVVLPARKYVSCAVVNNRAFCYGGQDSLNNITNSLIVVDVVSQQKHSLNGIPSSARKGGVAFSYNELFYFTTGLDENGIRLKETWKHNGVVGLTENENGGEVTVFPNPGTAKTTVRSPEIIKSYVIYNSAGRIVYASEVNAKEITLDISAFNPGLYFVMVIAEQTVSLKKLNVVR